MRHIGVDVSHWQSHIDWKTFKDGGVEFATVKVSQGDYLLDDMRADHLNGASSQGIATGAFFWIDPVLSPESNCRKALESAQGLPVTYFCPDVEQWWSDWASYRAWKAGQGPEPPHFDPMKLASHTKQVMLFLQSNTRLPVKLYTSRSFIMEHMPQLTLFQEFPTWELYLAQYPKQPPAGVYTWPQIKGFLPGSTWSPALPPNGKLCRMAQWSGDVIIPPGYNHVVDFDYFDGTPEEFAVFFGTAAPSPPVQSWEASIDAWARTMGYMGPKPM